MVTLTSPKTQDIKRDKLNEERHFVCLSSYFLKADMKWSFTRADLKKANWYRMLMHLLLLTVAALIFACTETPEKQYKKREKKELSSGVRYDSLFMGLYFQMLRREFREYCYKKHLDGKFYQGGRRNSVWVEAKISGLDYPGYINFYPDFEDDRITEMNASIYYDGGTVFKDGQFEKDSLLMDVLHLMDNWYGGPFIKIKSPFFYKEDVYVNVKGNRRITVYPDQSGQMINLWYVDLLALQQNADE